LQSQAISAQSANITGVSGATYTTSSWKASLASAISQIVVAPAPAPTPAPTQAQPSTPPVVVFPTPTSVQQSVPANSSPAANAVPAPTGTGCATSAPIIMNQPDFTSPPYPSGAPSPYGAPFPSGLPIPISTLRAGENSVVTQQQVYLQLATQNWIQTITKTSAQFQTVTCTVTTTATPTATPTVTVFVTTTPDPAFIIKPGAAVVLKNFICAKTVAGVTSVKVLKAKTIKCPTGYKLAKS
jgi:hypothetical protein